MNILNEIEVWKCGSLFLINLEKMFKSPAAVTNL